MRTHTHLSKTHRRTRRRSLRDRTRPHWQLPATGDPRTPATQPSPHSSTWPRPLTGAPPTRATQHSPHNSPPPTRPSPLPSTDAPRTRSTPPSTHKPHATVIHSPGFQWAAFGIGAAAAFSAMLILALSIRLLAARQNRKQPSPVATA